MNKSHYFNVYNEKNRFFTRSLVKGQSVYGEKIVGGEYREWVPIRSKLGAALRVGLKNFPFKKDSKILYLGCSSGTTCSHVSDICTEGRIFGLDVAFRVFTRFMELCNTRKNLYPVFADAKHPDSYDFIGNADIVFQDIAQKDQVYIFINNCKKFLKKDGHGFLVVKARSVDVTQKPQKIFAQVREQLKQNFTVLEEKDLKPFEKDHALFVIKK